VKTFLLIGIGGVYNYGCEAIVRGTEAILRSEWPDCRIVYASRRPEDDRARLAGCNHEIIYRRMLGRYSIPNITRKLLSLMGILWSPVLESLAAIEDYDAVLSIGGDLYTLGHKGNFSASLAKFGDAVERRGVPYILWGASVGPFSQNPSGERFYRRHLSRISLITARERDTVDYLAGIGVSSNVVPCADPAFAVAPEIVKTGSAANQETTIAINLSPLSVLHAGLTIEQGAEAQAGMVERIIRRHKARVILIPHVVCDFHEGDDDLRYLRRVREGIAGPCKNRVEILDTDPGFIATKKTLIQCDLVIAARMHCAINAMAAHVPTLLLSYSQKSLGMCEYIYGRRDWVHPVDAFGSDACLATVGRMLEAREQIQASLSARIPGVQADARRPLQALKRLLASG
jgi:polysaccharide pyruvyl transferase WcaK-like protein